MKTIKAETNHICGRFQGFIDPMDGTQFAAHLRTCIKCQKDVFDQIRGRYVSSEAMANDLQKKAGFERIHRATIIRWQADLKENKTLPPRGLLALETLGLSKNWTKLRVALHPAIQALPALLVHPYVSGQTRDTSVQSAYEKFGGKIDLRITASGGDSVSLVEKGDADITIASAEIPSDCPQLASLGSVRPLGQATKKISTFQDLENMRIIVPAGSAMSELVFQLFRTRSKSARRPDAYTPADLPSRLRKDEHVALIGWQDWVMEAVRLIGNKYATRLPKFWHAIDPQWLPGMPVAIYVNTKTIPVNSLRVYLGCLRSAMADLRNGKPQNLAEISEKFFQGAKCEELLTQASWLSFNPTLGTIIDLWNREEVER